MTVENIPVEEEPKVPTTHVELDDAVNSEKGYYHVFHAVLNFHNRDSVDRKEYQAEVDPDPDG